MLHLIKYNLLVKLRNFNMTFWPLVFPLILGTFFFFAFGNLNDADFETVQVAMVQETSPNPLFSFYIDQVKKSNSDLLNIQEMDESAALTALKSKKISGIYYNEMTPSLTVNAHGIPESILQSILENYNNSLHTIQNILKEHPSRILNGLSQMADTRDLVQELSLGGKTIDGNSQFFYALIAMACLYGCFIGFGAAITLQANLTALAARRCVTPTHKLKLILSADYFLSARIYRCNYFTHLSQDHIETGFSGTNRKNAYHFTVRKPDRCFCGAVCRKSRQTE